MSQRGLLLFERRSRRALLRVRVAESEREDGNLVVRLESKSGGATVFIEEVHVFLYEWGWDRSTQAWPFTWRHALWPRKRTLLASLASRLEARELPPMRSGEDSWTNHEIKRAVLRVYALRAPELTIDTTIGELAPQKIRLRVVAITGDGRPFRSKPL